jgi:hypothetical protein
VQGQEAVLVSELQAGWYRYISQWRFHANGTIRPRFGFSAANNPCTCKDHHHHVYWRLDFDIRTAGNNVNRGVQQSAARGRVELAYEAVRDPSAARCVAQPPLARAEPVDGRGISANAWSQRWHA